VGNEVGCGADAITSAAGVEKEGDAGAGDGATGANVAGAAGAGVTAGGAAGAVSSGFFPSAASRSSSWRDEGVDGIPKMPVALDDDPPEGSSDWGD
jgi:hypothetical protein